MMGRREGMTYGGSPCIQVTEELMNDEDRWPDWFREHCDDTEGDPAVGFWSCTAESAGPVSEEDPPALYIMSDSPEEGLIEVFADSWVSAVELHDTGDTFMHLVLSSVR